MLTCFRDAPALDDLDRRAAVFSHKLLEHPALSLQNLAKALPALPRDQVFHSSGRLDMGDDFDRAHLDKTNGLTLRETLEDIKTSGSYIMVRSPETDPSFRELHRQLMADVGELMQRRGVGRAPHEPMLYLFIASPGSVTPFHVDRYSTFLMQFRGTKQVSVFPMWDPRVVPADELEGFMAKRGVRPRYRPESEPLGTVFDFAPGQAMHIPFMAGHWVKNGADDVSISMSIIFNTDETVAISNAMRVNDRLRRLGLSPRPARDAGPRELGKSYLYRAWGRVRRALGR